MSLPSHQPNQLADHCYLVRKHRQVLMNERAAQDALQIYYRLQTKFGLSAQEYDKEQREYWERYERKKPKEDKKQLAEQPTSTPLAVALAEAGITTEELLEVLRG
jgi:hypothetical protein